MPTNPEEFAAELCTLYDYMRARATSRPSPLRDAVVALFDQDPSSLALVSNEIPPYDLPNMQVALDHVLSRAGVETTSIGIMPDAGALYSDLGNLVLSEPRGPEDSPLREGPMTFANVELGEGRVLPCVQLGMFITKSGGSNLVYFVSARLDGLRDKVSIQVLARDRDEALAAMADFKATMAERDVYRGHVLEVRASMMEKVEIRFANLDPVPRDSVILPPGLLEEVERHATGISHVGAQLLAAGCHLRRGTLLSGPPGNGKTLTTRFLAGNAKGCTVLLLSGVNFGSLSEVLDVARRLQPSMVIMDDADLVAEDRTSVSAPGLLHELMNAMDGLAGDADIQFVLTTNRAEVLEPALALRPGRIDLSVEIPLPDADCRERLFRHFTTKMQCDGVDWQVWVAATEGASATYIRELVRQAARESLESGHETVVLRQENLQAASDRLLESGGELGRKVLGFRSREGVSEDVT